MFKKLLLISTIPLLSGCLSGEIQLIKPAITCEYAGESYTVGSVIPVESDLSSEDSVNGETGAKENCNTCFCDQSGELVCTERVCEPKTEVDTLTNVAAVKCSIAGFSYETRTMENQEQINYCVDKISQTECLAWDFYRGECLLGETVQRYTAELKDVTGTGSSGRAETSYQLGNFRHTLIAKNLPPLEEDYFYEGWLVRVEPLEVLSTGKLTSAKKESEFTLNFESTTDLSRHIRVVVTLEPDDDDPAPAIHVLEGILENLIP